MKSVIEPELSAMHLAAMCAAKGAPRGTPPVGATIVHKGQVLSTGFSSPTNGHYAEWMALQTAGEHSRGATIFVTLEPCDHLRATRSCVQALIDAGIARVVFAVQAPQSNDFSSGKAWLEAAGIVVEQGFDATNQRVAEQLIAPWKTFVTEGRAHVTLKVAMSLDGRIATRNGDSRWITGEEARKDVHALRARCDAVMVGSNTARMDDPELTVRHVTTEQQPVRVVVDGHASLSVASKLVTTAREVATWVIAGEHCSQERVRVLRDAGVVVAQVAEREGHVDLFAALRWLASQGIVSVLSEGGGGLHGAMLDAGLGDRVVAYVAPLILGGTDARPAFGGHGSESLALAHRLRDVSVTQVGSDWRFEGELR
jgi:diaminohydroxyphosphoribosylaminopyrimidine deaminase / 5-amino-6-(5-phosphoribosylamino)uracil reductase